jgi:hypothetical protein
MECGESLISKLEHWLHNWDSTFGRAGHVFLDVRAMQALGPTILAINDHRWITGRDYDCQRVKPIAYKYLHLM